MAKLTIGTWNVHTLLDNVHADRPDRRTALVANELVGYSINIAALQETRFAVEGQLTERVAGYTFFWSGCKQDDHRESGVGFAIRSNLLKNLDSLPKGFNDRLMVMQLPLPAGKKASLISAYAPTMTNPGEVKDKFYEEFNSLLSSIPKEHKLIVLGDFNARVGCDYRAWGGTLGKHGIGKSNSNGLLLLQTCSSHDLIITNKLFRLATEKKTTWMHPRSKHWHMLDYIITRMSDRDYVRVTKAMCGAQCWTDHRLVSRLNIHIRPKRRPQGKKTPPKRLDTAKLKEDVAVSSLVSDLNDRVANLTFGNASIEEEWASFRDVVYSASL